MKKGKQQIWIAAILAAVLVFALAGCGIAKRDSGAAGNGGGANVQTSPVGTYKTSYDISAAVGEQLTVDIDLAADHVIERMPHEFHALFQRYHETRHARIGNG